MYDLRSDTVTKPSSAMRRAMAEAEVGDDVYREDPTMRRLETRVAEILGKEAALFVPSGTMANQIGILCHTRPSDDVIAGEGAHCGFYESGAAAALAHVQLIAVGKGGLYTAADVEVAIKPNAYYLPRTSLVLVENTHNRSGGRVFPQSDIDGIVTLARARGLALHLDGARLWNAAAATNKTEAELAAPFDTISVCFSKGLGAPVGSALAGDRASIERALRFRKMLGGGMRQAGILAAGALYAVENNRARLLEDHAAARRLGDALAQLRNVTLGDVQTNMVVATFPMDASRVIAEARDRGVLFSATGPRTVRMVTHLDVVGAGFDDCIAKTVEAFRTATA